MAAGCWASWRGACPTAGGEQGRPRGQAGAANACRTDALQPAITVAPAGGHAKRIFDSPSRPQQGGSSRAAAGLGAQPIDAPATQIAGRSPQAGAPPASRSSDPRAEPSRAPHALPCTLEATDRKQRATAGL